MYVLPSVEVARWLQHLKANKKITTPGLTLNYMVTVNTCFPQSFLKIFHTGYTGKIFYQLLVLYHGNKQKGNYEALLI